MAKPNPGQSRGSVTSNVKSYSGSVGGLPTGTKTTGGAKGHMNTAGKAKAGCGYEKGKGC